MPAAGVSRLTLWSRHVRSEGQQQNKQEKYALPEAAPIGPLER